jgi:hypothetical protein
MMLAFFPALLLLKSAQDTSATARASGRSIRTASASKSLEAGARPDQRLHGGRSRPHGDVRPLAELGFGLLVLKA